MAFKPSKYFKYGYILLWTQKEQDLFCSAVRGKNIFENWAEVYKLVCAYIRNLNKI